jgi:hypothetical protein
MKTVGLFRWAVVLLPFVAAAPGLAQGRQGPGGEDKEDGNGAVAEAALPAEYCFTSGSVTGPD